MIQTTQKFEVADLDAIIGMPIIELDEDFKTFSLNNLGFSVEKRTRVINKYVEVTGKKPSKKTVEKYIFTLIFEEMRSDSNYQIFTKEEMIEKLNSGKRQYRLATPDECRYIAMKRFEWLQELPLYEKMH